VPRRCSGGVERREKLRSAAPADSCGRSLVARAGRVQGVAASPLPLRVCKVRELRRGSALWLCPPRAVVLAVVHDATSRRNLKTNVRAEWSLQDPTAAALGGQPRPVRDELERLVWLERERSSWGPALSARADPARLLTQLYSQSVMGERSARRSWFGVMLCWGGQGLGVGAAASAPAVPATAEPTYPPLIFELRIKTSTPHPPTLTAAGSTS